MTELSDFLRGPYTRETAAWRRTVADLRDRLSAAEQALHPTTEEGLGALIETLRGQVELDEGGYCVLCTMHYTSEEEIADSERRALAAEARAEAAEPIIEAARSLHAGLTSKHDPMDVDERIEHLGAALAGRGETGGG